MHRTMPRHPTLQRFHWPLALAGLLLAAPMLVCSAQSPVQQPAQAALFARVGEQSISQAEYEQAFAAATRARFYHGKPPDTEIASMQRQVADQLVARVLLLREVKRRGLRADAAQVQQQLAAYEQRYANSPEWKSRRTQLLGPLRERLEQDTVLSQFEQSVRAQVQPTAEQVKAYFQAHRDKFTEPAQMRVSVILLRVDPSSSDAVWKASEEQARALLQRLRGGADFAALARQYSAEASAPQGGDMGYLHSGMLPDGSQAVLEKMQIGETSEPQRLLEGYAVFRLVDRKQAVVHSWDTVQLRAQQLTQRELANLAWDALLRDLKARTPVQIDQSRFLPLAN